MRLGLSLPTMPTGAPADLTHLAAELEQLGFESLWASDVMTGAMPSLEAVTTLAAAAGATSTVGLGFGVLVLPLRPLPLLATQLGTLQHVSGNRLLLGVGSGGFPGAPFWQAMGVAAEDRAGRTDEALRLLPSLLAGEPTTVDGVELTLGPPAPMPPVLVGGNSARALRRVEEHGAAWFPSLISPAVLAARVAELPTPPEITVGGHMFVTDEGREEFVASIVAMHGLSAAEAEQVPMPGHSRQAIAEHLAAYAEAGASRVVLAPNAEDPKEFLAQCERIAAAQPPR